MPQERVIEAAPTPIAIDTARTAVLVVDMQNDFGAEGGMFDRVGLDIAPIKRAVVPTGNVLAAARKARIKIIYLKMEFRPDLSDAGADGSVMRRVLARGENVPAPDGRPSRFLIRDTWGTDIVKELAPQQGDIIVSKHRYSGFYHTELDTILKTLGIQYLVVTGCTTSVCVESTIRDAMFRDYTCILLEDCSAEPQGPNNHEASLWILQQLFGWVSSSEQFLKGLESREPVHAETAVGSVRA